jgi:hypothetical protein
MAKQKTTHEPITTTETLQEEAERLLRENAERNFQAWKESNPAPNVDAADNQSPAELAVEVAERALRPFGPAAMAGLRAGGSFISALKGANAEQVGKAAARLDLARQKTVARRGANLRADIPESSLAAAKAAESFLFDLGLEVAKRSDLF